MTTYNLDTITSGVAATKIAAAHQEFVKAVEALKKDESPENYATMIAKLTALSAEVVVPIAMCMPVVGNIASAVDLVNELKIAYQEYNGYTDFKGVKHPPIPISGERLQNISLQASLTSASPRTGAFSWLKCVRAKSKKKVLTFRGCV